MSRTVLTLDAFSVRLHARDSSLHVVDNVSWSVDAGSTLALVGESGSGKTVSTLGMLQLMPPNVVAETAGRVLLNGRDISGYNARQMDSILGGEVGVVFQDPLTALNPMRTVGSQIAEVARRHLGMSRDEARTHGIDLLERVDIPEPAQRFDRYPHEMSGGMRQRAVIAMAVAAQPSLLIADEPTTALDVTTQAQLLDLLKTLQAEHEMAMVLITHDIGVVASMADRVAVMYAGRLVEIGDAGTVLKRPDHPYTRGLLDSVPDPREAKTEPFRALPGLPPDLAEVGAGCRFAPRCSLREATCTAGPPVLELLPSGRQASDGWRSACWKHPGRQMDLEEVSS